jgi:DNA-binding response OmpR family regulator
VTGLPPRRRVLFIEDDPDLREVYQQLFAGGFDLAFAATGAEALVQLREFRPDRLVLDIQLPDANGLDFLRRLRERNGTLPVVITTGFREFASALERSGLAYQRLLLKPFPMDELAAALDAVG